MATTKQKDKSNVSIKNEMLAGALAGATARFVVAPLDVLKIRFQIQHVTSAGQLQYPTFWQSCKTIAKEEGLMAFWKGNVPAQIMMAGFCAVQFAVYSQSKAWIKSSSIPEEYHNVTSLLAGSASGMAATMATYPLDLMRTRLAAQQSQKLYPTLASGFQHVLRQEGVTGLYTGIGPALWSVVPSIAIQFAIYEGLARFGKNTLQLPTSGALDFSYGFIAGIIGKFVTMPFDVLKKRYQVKSFEWEQSVDKISKERVLAHLKGHDTYRDSTRATALRSGMFTLARDMVRHEGIGALFRGTVPSMLKAGPNSAVTFAAYEAFLRLLNRQSTQDSKQSSL